MMRSPSAWSLAVRKPDGEIAQLNHEINSVMARHRVFRLPIIRGVIALGESLAIGFRALAISANYAAQEEGDDEEVSTEIGRGALIFAFAIAIGFALLLFKVTPALVTSWLPIETTGAFVVVEGLIRVTIFILYLVLISFLPDLKRVFQYHAAEHKAINAYEAGDELEPERVQSHSLIHPLLRDGVPALGDGDRDLRLRVLRPAGLVLADREPDPAPARDRRNRLRADPLRRQAHEQPDPDDAARAGPLAPAADHARADARPARGLDQRAPGRPPAGGRLDPEERKVEVMA